MSFSESGFCWNFGIDLQHHVVLVQLREDGGDLALAEGVVERVVDGLRRECRGATRCRGR